MSRLARSATVFALAAAAFFIPLSLRGEAMLQYFNTDWNEIAARMPELAEAGYNALWLPPPTKGSGGLSTGYDLWDRFDLGSKDQRGSVRTRYGTEAELLRLIEIAHRFGIRIYFDNIMNHNAFDIPGFDANTPIDIYPGFVPEDFHLRVTEDGSYRKWDNTRNWGDAWQVQHLGLADLIDIAQEPGGTNENFGPSEGGLFPKIKFLRHPNNPEYYCFLPNGQYVGFGPNNGITTQILQQNSGFYSERVEDMLNRSARWLMDRTRADGLRLDAVKHVRADFFGATFGADKDFNSYGYMGQAQDQFNKTRGFSDGNHRDTVFDTEQPRDDAMMFGEHLGEPPSYGDYINSGMRLVDNPLREQLNNKLGNPSDGLSGFDQPGAGGFSPEQGVMHAQSHDNDYATRRELQHAFYFTRAGIGLLYTDGNNQAGTLGESGGAFPRHANTNFLGQYGDVRIPNLLYIHNQFARGYQIGRWADADFVAYERMDKRENPNMTDADGVTMLFMLNDNYANGQARPLGAGASVISFPNAAFTVNNAYLYNYSSYGGGFYKYASELPTVVVPPGGYFAFSWKNPDPSDLWQNGGGQPITILQTGQPVGTMTYERQDGRDGDKGFNPYNLPDADPTDLKYTFSVPRVTNGTDLAFFTRVDGSAENVLLQLDGGIDLNSQLTPPIGPTTGDKRDNPPALKTDVFLGYEQMQFDHRQYGEKFAAVNTARCTVGSSGAETYVVGGAPVNGFGNNPADADTAAFVYHDPTADVGGLGGSPPKQLNGTTVWAKTNSVGAGYKMFVYYTTDGSNPEGAGGVGIGTTKSAQMNFDHNQDGGASDWWMSAAVPGLTSGSKYKIGTYKDTVNNLPAPSLFPTGAFEAGKKKKMMTVFKVPTFNATTAPYRPHNDYGEIRTGLAEGFHVLRARAFLNRAGKASIYNTFLQTFYYDTQSPGGEIKFPATNGDTVGGQSYGVVVRADPSVSEVWSHIDDNDATNDDVATKVSNGNGIGFEPFTDGNDNATRDAGEKFTDLNGNGQWDSNVPAWVKVSELTPTAAVSSTFPREWRFDYRNIPASGPGTIRVRLREISSSAQFSTVANADIADAAGHFTTLTRSVVTAGDPQRMDIAFPGTNGQTVGEGYVMKVRFSNSLAGSVEELRSKFVVKIASSESGSVSGAVTQSNASYQFIANSAPGYHDLAFPLPNLYNGAPDFIHTIQVTCNRPGNSPLVASRQVRAAPTAQGSFVNIVNPPEFDSDGKRHEIVLPDVPNPTAAQRQTTIVVETSTDVESVSIAFVNNAGTATLAAATVTPLKAFVAVTNGSTAVSGTEKQIAGTVNMTAGGSSVTGTGTQFTSELAVGDLIRIGAQNFTVQTLTSDTALVTAETATAGASSAAAYLQPQFDQNLSVGNTIQIAGVNYTVGQINSPSSLTLNSPYAGTTASGLVASRVDTNPLLNGTKKFWTFHWTGMTAGSFTFIATAIPSSGPAVTAMRNATVVFRQIVPSDEADADDDNDGLGDTNETTTTALPTTNPETWKNGEVHVYYAYGHTNPLSPDTDGDGLPDGLEVGWRTAPNPPTDPNADTNGDGIPNFIGDLDPPFYNTLGNDYPSAPTSNFGRVPNVNSSNEGGDRAKQVAGSATNPNAPDTDNDGIMDGVEDANRDGWVNGDGASLPTNFLPFSGRNWPNGKMDPGETWTESDPNNADTDDDGLLDGYGEDKDFNGQIEGDTNGNRSWQSGEQWTESDPLKKDSDGDGLPDGWEVNNGLDPLDNGTANFGGGASLLENGANGDPDGDGFTNIQELTNGTDPRAPTSITPPPPGSIIIGPQAPVTVGAVSNIREFTDWSANDLIVLDEYDGGGTNNQGSDVFHAYDGFDSSRDLVAFYAHDGGDNNPALPPQLRGDGNFYFRVDLQDLKANAEAGNLDIYVVIDSGNAAVGEYALPDDVDTGTEMRWEAVVACYSSNNGRVYIDTNAGSNSTAIGQVLSGFGVVARDQTVADGFKKAYFNSDLDSVEFSISRKALRDAGWNGDPTLLNFQVFTTRDGTNNSPTPGAGDIGGRSDVRDTFYDDFLASDYFKDQSNIAGDKSVLKAWFSTRPNQPGGLGSNDRGKRAKVMSLVHGNQTIMPGSAAHALINTGAGAGYYRPLDVHQAYQVPVAMHITPTLASSIQWAKSATNGFRDGPALNARIKTLRTTTPQVVDLLGSTFADHIPAYFTSAFNNDNVAVATNLLDNVYNGMPSAKVFWSPERILDSNTFAKIDDLGFEYTFVDQMRHLFKWFGRTSALGNDGYRINLINGVKTFVINDQASTYRFQNSNNGLPLPLRELLGRKARSGTQDQVITLFSAWEDFTTKAQADAYDVNMRWLASRPWIQMVTPDQIANGQIDLSVPPDGTGDAWAVKDRSTDPGAANVASKVAPDYIDHATEENYDNWYYGLASREESLRDKVFSVRTGVALPKPFGILDAAEPSGIISDTWTQVAAMSPMASGLGGLNTLARTVVGAALFETAFHNQTNNDLSKFSTGAYISPDTDFHTLAAFASISHAQTRHAAVYKKVYDWANAATNTSNYVGSSFAEQADVDQDGENEYLLYNDRFFALFERLGGRMTASWLRDIDTGYVTQVSGNFSAYANSLTEEEGISNAVAYRTSAFKDWFAKVDNSSSTGISYVNDFYSVVPGTGGVGWKFTSSDGKVAKNITLPAGQARLTAQYTTIGYATLFVRFGFSPDLLDLLQNGQANLQVIANAQEVNLFNSNVTGTVRGYLRVGGSGFSGATYNAAASDVVEGLTPDTLPMRNQAQTQQVEIQGGSSMTFAVGFETGAALSYDSDGDGLPDWFENQHGLDPYDSGGLNGAGGDPDGDGKTNREEYILGSNPTVGDANAFGLTITRPSLITAELRFGTIRDRIYRIFYRSGLTSGQWTQAGPDIAGVGGPITYVDNGGHTGSPPTAAQPRFYKLEVSLIP